MKSPLIVLLFLFTTCLSFAQKNIQLLSYLPLPDKINDIWGYATNNKEYALIGAETGVFIVDVTNPSSPQLLHTIPGDTSIWRDLKTFNQQAYVVNETGGGLLIIDLSNLPQQIDYQYVTTIDTLEYLQAHNIFIDSNGVAYLLGSNIGNQGALMIDVNTPNIYQPALLGNYNQFYVHDAFARNDTLYTAEILNGSFSIVDVSDKNNPIILAQQETGTRYAHNCWLSDDGNYLISTDEKPGAFVEIYDISNLSNIQLLDQYRSNPYDSVIPHNTYFKGDYILTSYYRDGLTVVDATIKDNLVEIGNYDTSPFSSAPGFEGNWGVYPYLPSGNIIVSDREEGLFVLGIDYKRASYIRGTAFDTLNNQAIGNGSIEIIGKNTLAYTQFNGSYTTGHADSSFIDIRFSKPGCQTVIQQQVLIEPGIEKIVNFETQCFSTSIAPLAQDTYIDCLYNATTKEVVIKFNKQNSNEYTISCYSLTGSLLHPLITTIDQSTTILSELPQNQVFIIVFTSNNQQGFREIFSY